MRSEVMTWKHAASIVAIGVLHRTVVFFCCHGALQALISANPDWLTWQYPWLRGLTERLSITLLYLQQTPPLPSAVLGLAAKTFGWPHGTALCLVGLQALFSIGSSLLLCRLLTEVIRRPLVACGLSLLFLLSTDLLVMEYNSFGQTFYENLAMFLLLMALWFGLLVLKGGKGAHVIGLGLCAGALALTRSSYSYFWVIPAVFVGVLVLERRLGGARPLLAYFACILLTQGAWSVKNLAVYGTFSMSTTTWGGSTLVAGVVRGGDGGQAFLESILADPKNNPAWFRRMVREHGLLQWEPILLDLVPARIRQEDARIQAILGGTNRPENSIAQREVSDRYARAYARFCLGHPGLALRRFVGAYEVFWMPIRCFARYFVGPLFVEPRISTPLALGDLVRVALQEVNGEEQFYMVGPYQSRTRRAGHFFTIPSLPGLLLPVNILVLHLIAPLLLLAMVWRRTWRYAPSGAGDPREANTRALLILLMACYAYGAVTMNLANTGENMRFRLSLEPVIWLITAGCLAESARWVRRQWLASSWSRPEASKVRELLVTA